MSGSLRTEPSTEPHGIRLPYPASPPLTTPFGDFERVRSSLVATTVTVVCVVLLLGAGAAGLILAQWYPTTTVTLVFAGAVALVCIVAALRLFALFRSLSMIPAQSPAHSLTGAVPAPAPVQQVTAQAPQAPAPQAPAPILAPMAPVAVETTKLTEGIQQWGDVFGKLSRRMQSLVNRLIRSIDDMEHELEDPELLGMLWSIDHLATLVRRQAENIAILGGEPLERRSDMPVDVNAVLRSAVAEIQRYRDVITIPIRDARIHGHAVAEIIHLLSELLDNATFFSPDDAPKVTFRAQYVTAGLAIEVQDRGIGMATQDLRDLNQLLRHETDLDVGELFKDGRIGLAVVKELARRHNVGIELQLNIYGGIDASIVIPHRLLDARLDARLDTGAGRRIEPETNETGTTAVIEATVPGAPQAPATPPRPQEPVVAQQPPDWQWLAEGQGGQAPQQQQQQQQQQYDQSSLPVRQRGTTLAAVAPEQLPQTAQQSPQSPQALKSPQLPQNPHDRPPLPQRREQPSHLRPELREAPVLTRPIPGHSPSLLADLQLGRAAGLDDIAQTTSDPGAADGNDDQPQHANDVTHEGGNGSWPTI